MALIEVHELTRKYSDAVFALNAVSFAVEKGEWLAVMGPSGSGKSTLLNVLGCLDAPSAGSVRVDGEDLAQLRGDALARFRAEKVGFVFQQFHLVPYLNAVENVMLAQYFHSLADEQEATEALRRVGLADRLRHLPSELSGGEQQRVCVARALINEPNLILADEPTGNLDEVNETIVMSLFTELHRAGHTIVMVTHDPEIGRMAERRIELHHGRLTDVSVYPAGEEELIDNLLKAVWHAREDSRGNTIVAETFPGYVKNRATFLLMAQEELVHIGGGKLVMSARGESRARGVIRRHRLAERLFFDTFGLDATLLDSNACRIEHTLGAEVVEKLCTFLHHPETCPHGSPIPRGTCCPVR